MAINHPSTLDPSTSPKFPNEHSTPWILFTPAFSQKNTNHHLLAFGLSSTIKSPIDHLFFLDPSLQPLTSPLFLPHTFPQNKAL